MANILYNPVSPRTSVGLLILRLVAGTMLMFHGWGKIHNPLHWMGDSPVPAFLQACAAVSEFGGGAALIVGLLTPLASFGIACTMGYALTMVLIPMKVPIVASKPGENSMEIALLLLATALLLLIAGPGAASLDRLFFQRRHRY